MNKQNIHFMPLFFLIWSLIILVGHTLYTPAYQSWAWAVSTWTAVPVAWRIFMMFTAAVSIIAATVFGKTMSNIFSGGLNHKYTPLKYINHSAIIYPVLFLVFFLLRTRVFYGDANVNFYRGIYSNFLTYEVFRFFTAATWFIHWSDVTRIAILSCICGLVYVRGVKHLCGLLLPGITKTPVTMFLLTIIPVQLFFGYIEVYFTLAAVIPWFLGSGILVLKQQRNLHYAALWFGMAMLFHLSAAWLVFSFLILILSVRRKMSGIKWMKACLPSLGILAGMLVFMQVTIFLTVYQSNRDKFIWDYTHVKEERTFRSMSGGGDQKMFIPLGGDSYTLFSGKHLSDFFNEMMFLSPMLFPMIVFGLRFTGRGEETWNFLFMFTAAAGFAAYAFMWKSDLGYPKDWDLFAVAGIICSITFGYMLASVKGNSAVIPLLIAVVLNIFHTGPWIISNAAGVGKTRNKILLSLGGPVDLHTYTIMRDYPVPSGTRKLSIPVRHVHSIAGLVLESEVIMDEVAAKSRGNTPAKIKLQICIEHDEDNPVCMTPFAGVLKANQKRKISFDHNFDVPLHPKAIHIKFPDISGCRMIIHSLKMIQEHPD